MTITKKVLEKQNENLRRELLFQRDKADKERREEMEQTAVAIEQIRQAMDTILFLVCRQCGVNLDNVLTLTLSTDDMASAGGYTVTAERSDGAYLIQAKPKNADAAEPPAPETT